MTRTPQDSSQPEVFGVHHAAFRCRDATETCDFYVNILGFPLIEALDLDHVTSSGAPIPFLHIFFDIGSHDPNKPSYIAFFEVDERAALGFDFKQQSGLDLHFAMGVRNHDDLRKWQARLEKRGVNVEGPVEHGITTSIYFHDPNGYRLEFVTQDAKQLERFDARRDEAAASVKAWADRKAARAHDAAQRTALTPHFFS